MIPKRSIIVALAGVNLLLLTALVLSSYSLPTAYAQRMGASSNFVAVTSQSDKDYDVLFLLDLAERRLHCFTPNRDRSGHVSYAGSRDLQRDFTR
ncbi:MAG: hypothetical protein V3W34_19595 [Phycisphaerae bacterium]